MTWPSHARARSFVPAIGVLLAFGLSGCPTPTPEGDAGIDAARPDGGEVRPDGARSCTMDSQCDDRVACTRDSCGGRGYCLNVLDHAVCADMTFCNGVEQCDPVRGCVPGPRQTCDDGMVCTIDRCNEAMKTCENVPRDLDRDGDVDFFCTGGGDCNDRDPTVSSDIPEICDDGIDNDCDDLLDEPDCGRAPHDTCADPLMITAEGNFMLDTASASPDYTLACVGMARQDLVAALVLTEPHDVRIEASADRFSTILALRTTCDSAATESDCVNGFPAVIRRRALPAGTYYIILSGFGSGPVNLGVQLMPPTAPPANEVCAGAILIPSTGGTYAGSFLDGRDDTLAGCGVSGSPDHFYQFDLTAPQDVRISATSATGESMSFALRPTCDSPTGELRCAYGSPAGATYHQLPAGHYFIVVEGPTYVEVDYSLVVDFLPPSPPVRGDTCADAIPVVVGTPFSGTLAGAEDDVDISCGFHYRDIVHSFSLAAASDVSIDVNGGTAYLAASTRPMCAVSGTQLRCDAGTPVHQRIRGLAAGTYYVVVEGLRAGTYTLTVTASAPPSVPVAVVGNDSCLSAHDVPATGGLFSGNTTMYLNDTMTRACGNMAQSPDVVYRLVLPARSRVIASTDGSSFDTVLYMYAGLCPMTPEAFCDDDGGDGNTSLIDRTLDAGTYYFVVDGWGMGSAGNYEFEVQVIPS